MISVFPSASSNTMARPRRLRAAPGIDSYATHKKTQVSACLGEIPATQRISRTSASWMSLEGARIIDHELYAPLPAFNKSLPGAIYHRQAGSPNSLSAGRNKG